VPYHIQTAPVVADYLARLAATDISPEALVTLVEEYTADLGEKGDHYHEREPLAHEAMAFRYETVLVDGNNLWGFEFVVDAHAKESGVLVVAYVEAQLLGTRGE